SAAGHCRTTAWSRWKSRPTYARSCKGRCPHERDPPAMYLQQLTQRLAQGMAPLPQAERDRHVAYLQKAQNADGGFSGRLGGSDLYYTGFALRSLAVLNALTPEIFEKAASFLRSSRQQHASVIDLFSLLYGCLLIQTVGGPDVLADSPPDW